MDAESIRVRPDACGRWAAWWPLSGLRPEVLPVCLAACLASCATPEEDRDLLGDDGESAVRAVVSQPVTDDVRPVPPIFEDVTDRSGLDFVHFNGMSGGYYYSEMMGSGGALFDADGDGDLDLYLVQGAELGGVAAADSLRPPPSRMLPLRDRLYLNQGMDRQGLDHQGELDGVPRFVDATEASGLDVRGYGMGAVAADFDGDGHADLYVTHAGPNELWFGRGDGTFTPAESIGDAAAPAWSIAAVPVDVDGDGDLDLFVANYVDYSIAIDKQCTDTLGQRNYCGPLAYPPVRDVLLRNRGNGRFDDVSLEAGLDAAYGRALGAGAADLDGDGRPEIFVANDGDENQLWHLRAGSGTAYQDMALLWGVAVNATGHAEASMGVALGDAELDGDLDLFVTHLNRETNTLYAGRRDSDHVGFDDRSTESGLGAPSFDRTGFGTVFVDWDLDGDLDLPVANGAVKVIPELSLAGDPFPLHQPNQLFRNLAVERDGMLRFEEIADPAWTGRSEVSRAILAGDLDGDGDDDLVVTNNSGPARLFLNRAADGRAWLGVVPVDERGRLVHHATAELVRGDGVRLLRQVQVASGYASSQDPRLRFGLNAAAGEVADQRFEVRVRWPDGTVESFADLAPGVYHSLRRGGGVPEADE